MTSRIIKIFRSSVIIIILLISCKSKKNVLIKPLKGDLLILVYHYSKYDADFPPKLKVENNGFGTGSVEEWFKEGGLRFGKIGIYNSKEGKWLSGNADFDKDENVYAKGKIWREEYFKNGLRDSIYRCFDSDGKIIYETIFKKGTGLWKEFHSNGTLYFEIYTKDGYFTDTLKLYNDAGKIVGRRLYVKDSLIYDEGLPCFPYRPDSVPSD